MSYLRYHRQELLIDKCGQQKLKNARVLCVGAGGLGSPLLLYLAGAGVGTIGIVDHDTVELSNLHRQIIFSMQDLGLKKGIAAKNKMLHLNPEITVDVFLDKLSLQNAHQIIANYDIIADCTDNFATRYVINDACFYLKKPNVSASIFHFEGQCSVFTALEGPCYRCLYPEISAINVLPNCAESGVLGVLPGLLGTIQATEILKIILGLGDTLIGRLLTVDAMNMQFREYQIKRDRYCVLCGENSKSLSYPKEVLCMSETIPEISVTELAEWQKEGRDFLLLDVREPSEYAECEMGGTLIPIGELPNRLNELNPAKQTVVHCRGGGRSKRAAALLKEAGFQDVRNLTGGITAWVKAQENNC